MRIGLRLDEDQGLAAHFYGDVRETVCKALVSLMGEGG